MRVRKQRASTVPRSHPNRSSRLQSASRKGMRDRTLGKSDLRSTAGDNGGQKALYLEVTWKFLVG